MPRSLFSKLVTVLLGLLLVTGAFYVALTITTTRLHIQEVTQNLNRTLAADLAKNKLLIEDGKVDKAALKKIFDMMMVVNPTIEVYLLDAEGGILAYSAAEEKIKRRKISLDPIRDFTEGKKKLPIRGNDPRTPDEQKIFSATAIKHGGEVRGYLYVVLGGEAYDSVAGMFETSWIMRLSTGIAIASLGLIAVLGILLFNWLTRRLRLLTRRVENFKVGESTDTQDLPAHDPTRPMDEIDELTSTFAEMGRRIEDQIQELEHADAQRRELITNISHDLRTPLASLQGTIETLQIKDRDLSPEEKRHYLDLAHKHSQRLSRLISDLFELTTLDSEDRQIRLEPFSLAELMQDVAQKFRASADEKGLKLDLDPPLNTSLVSGDIGLIERVLANLAENAVKYTPRGGQIRMGVVRADGHITAIVSDTGLGIPADDLPRIFDRSYRVNKDRGDGPGGAGLGLAIAKRILELHQARLEVESSPGVGSKFSFSLPAASGD
jgi:signal transduction histidine kinase